jgi:hypothetical protein
VNFNLLDQEGCTKSDSVALQAALAAAYRSSPRNAAFARLEFGWVQSPGGKLEERSRVLISRIYHSASSGETFSVSKT